MVSPRVVAACAASHGTRGRAFAVGDSSHTERGFPTMTVYACEWFGWVLRRSFGDGLGAAG